ncbi:MAG: WYL domain-containing protein [Candidatus Zixiibacteriota bacterium]|nr:MAG: WYL domain-containing protein [candidate division Zixibacteria bacterium]
MTDLPDFLKSQIFIAFDTETTGMWAPSNRIVEIAAVRFDLSGKELGTFQSLVNPGRQIPAEVISIHGITDEMVKEARLIKPVLEEFFSFCGTDTLLVAHNAPFDISFIGWELDRAGMGFLPNPILDTVDIYHRFFPGLPSYSLANLTQHFDIARSQEHRALSDARLVSRLVLNASRKLAGFKDLAEMREAITMHSLTGWQSEPATLPNEHSDIERAITDRLRVEIDYNHPVRASKIRVIRPQQVFKLGSIYYINAYCELARAERTFRLDRILSYRILPESL